MAAPEQRPPRSGCAFAIPWRRFETVKKGAAAQGQISCELKFWQRSRKMVPVGLIKKSVKSVIATLVLKTRKCYTPKGGRVQARRTDELTESPEARRDPPVRWLPIRLTQQYDKEATRGEFFALHAINQCNYTNSRQEIQIESNNAINWRLKTMSLSQLTKHITRSWYLASEVYLNWYQGGGKRP